MPRRRRRLRAPAEAVSESTRHRVTALFERQFQFEPPPAGWPLPEQPRLFSEQSWQVPELQAMKAQLNAVKARLSDKDIVAWHEHTCATSLAGLVVSTVKSRVRPELGTQAWCKFYELLSLWSVVPAGCGQDSEPLRSLHLCEAPGAFITALNHYCVLSGVRQWEWRASTLNPYHEGNPPSRMIADDRFILHTLERWQFGADDTGDLLAPANAAALLEGPGVHLVTADGSVDCQGQPAEQEAMVADLHLCELFCALQTLQPGGTLVLKMFTFFEASSVCLLYIINCCFQQVCVVKPSCSKAGNSEVYLVCRGRVAGQPPQALMDQWWERYGPQARPRPLLARTDVPDSFIQQLLRCADKFKALQEAEISRNLRLLATGAGGEPELEPARRLAADQFLLRCRLTAIDRQLRLTHPLDGRLHTAFQVENKAGAGTYEQRTGQRSAEQRLAAAAAELAVLPAPGPSEELVWRPPAAVSDPLLASSRTEGRPADRLLASKFCCPRLLRLLSSAPAVRRCPAGVLVTLPARWRPVAADAATVAALRTAAGLLRPGQALRLVGLFTLHRLSVSLLQLLAPLAAGGVVLLPPAGAPPRPRLELRAVAEPAALAELLSALLPLLTGSCLSLLPLPELCRRPAAQQLTDYNGWLVRALTEHLLRAAGAATEQQEQLEPQPEPQWEPEPGSEPEAELDPGPRHEPKDGLEQTQLCEGGS